MLERTFRVSELAKALRISPSHLRNAIRLGLLHATDIRTRGKKATWVISESAAAAWLGCKVLSTHEATGEDTRLSRVPSPSRRSKAT